MIMCKIKLYKCLEYAVETAGTESIGLICIGTKLVAAAVIF